MTAQEPRIQGIQEFKKSRKTECVPAGTPPLFLDFIGFLGFPSYLSTPILSSGQ